jgi:hypothetical protein
VKIEDLPPRYREQAKRQVSGRLAWVVPTDEAGAKAQKISANPAVKVARTKPKMTRVEAEYEAILVARHGRDSVVFEGLTLRLKNGHRYTPDLVVMDGKSVAVSRVTLVEVKGPYKLQSYQRARLAFDQSRVEYPCFDFVWAQKRRDGSWEEAK